VINYLFRKEMRTGLKINSQFREYDRLRRNRLHYLVRKDWPVLHGMIMKALASITPRELNELQEKWFGTADKESPLIQLTREEQIFLQNHPVIRAANELDYPPFDYAVGGRPSGYSIGLLKLLSERIGIKIEFVNGYSWTRLVNMFKQGDLDLLHTASKTPEREQFADFTDPYYFAHSYFATRVENPDIRNVTQLYSRTVAVGKGWAIEEYLALNHPKIRLLACMNMEEMLKTVSQGFAHATIGRGEILRYMIRKKGFRLKLTGRFREYDADKPKGFHILVRKDNTILLGMLNKALATLTPGDIETLERKWFGAEETAEARVELIQFSVDFMDSAGELEAAVAQGDSDKAHAMAHRLEGVSGNLAITGVFEAANEINDLLSRKKTKDAEKLLPALTASLETVIQSIKQCELSRTTSIPDKKTMDMAVVRPLFTKIYDALNQYDIETAEESIRSLEHYFDVSELAALSKSIRTCDYEGALTEIQAILKNLD